MQSAANLQNMFKCIAPGMSPFRILYNLEVLYRKGKFVTHFEQVFSTSYKIIIILLQDWFHLGPDSQSFLYPKNGSFAIAYCSNNCTIGFCKETMLCIHVHLIVGDFVNLAMEM